MLVLERRLFDSIVIGSGESRVVVQVVDIDRGKVRLGLTADRAIPIFRAELLLDAAGEPKTELEPSERNDN